MSKTFTQQFKELATDADKWEFLRKNLNSWCNELDAELEQAKVRTREAESKRQHREAWLNLYELNPHMALRNPHMGVIINPQPQQ